MDMKKNYDPHTEDGYRNIVETLAEVRQHTKDGMWKLYSTLFGVDVDEVLDYLYKTATDVYNQGKAKVEATVADTKEKVGQLVDGQVNKLVDEYIDEVLVPQANGNVSRKSLNDAHEALANYTRWILNR